MLSENGKGFSCNVDVLFVFTRLRKIILRVPYFPKGLLIYVIPYEKYVKFPFIHYSLFFWLFPYYFCFKLHPMKPCRPFLHALFFIVSLTVFSNYYKIRIQQTTQISVGKSFYSFLYLFILIFPVITGSYNYK